MNLLSNKCPKCLEGEIYKSFLSMNKACPQCGYVYEREEGYFTGPMFLDSMFLPLSAIPTVVIFAYNGSPILGGVLAVLQILILSPFVFRFSRLIWIHLDYKTNPSKG